MSEFETTITKQLEPLTRRRRNNLLPAGRWYNNPVTPRKAPISPRTATPTRYVAPIRPTTAEQLLVGFKSRGIELAVEYTDTPDGMRPSFVVGTGFVTSRDWDDVERFKAELFRLLAV